MKNLQKVLALGLALVMILGMFTFASAAEIKTASDFTDWDKVEHKDAVALCVDLGIINGMTDGSFAPERNITRAEWAKLVYFTATGDDDADAYLGTATGLKDITGNWAESYISYLYAMNWVAGDGNGRYNPKGSITVAAGLKTMLTVLGWDADDRGYQNAGSAWAGNVITDAKRNGLMNEIDRKNTANVELTRDNAAQIIYNALMAETVEKENGRDNGEKYVTKHTPTGVTLLKDVFDVIPVTATVKDVTDGVAEFEDPDVANTKDALNKAKIKATAANIGTKVTVFIHSNKKDVVSTVVASAGTTADVTFTDGVTIANITTKADSDKDHYVAAAADGIKYYLNGEEATLAASYPAGNVVEVFQKDGEVSMIKVTTYDVKKVEGDVETRTYKDEEEVKIPGLYNGYKKIALVDGWQGLADGDVVLVNTSKDVLYIEKAEKVTGKVTLRTGDKLTIGGTKYAASGLSSFSGEDAFGSWPVKGRADNEYDFFLDKNGDVCAFEQISGEVTTEVAYVLQCKKFSKDATSLSDSSSSSVEAELLFTDGTTQIVKVAKIGTTEVDDINDTVIATVESKLVDYSVDSKGNYELKAKTGTATVTPGKVSAAPGFLSDAKADNATVFLIAKGNSDDGYEYSVVTGYKNVPAMTATVAVAVANDDGIITYVYLETTKFDGEGSDGLIYVRSVDTDIQDTDDNYSYEVVDANGNKTTMVLTGIAKESMTVGFYVITATDDKGVATIKAVETEATDMTGAPTVGKGTVIVGTNAYATDSSTVCVVIDIDDGKFVDASGMSISSFKAETGYTYTGKLIVDGDNAEYIYIVRTTAAD